MKVVAIIQARLGSSRLPNKVLMTVRNRPLLGWLQLRLAQCSEIDEILIATTIKSEDDSISEFGASCGCRVYRGSEDDVLDRYYQAATMAGADVVVRVTADCPLLDPAVLDSMVREFIFKKVDFLSNSEPLPSTWPDGMDVSVISYKALEKAHRNALMPSEREHVTFHFWNNPREFQCIRVDHDPDLSHFRITLDYMEDFALIKAVIEHFEESIQNGAIVASMNAIVDYLISTNSIFNLNSKYVRGLGWEASFEKDRAEGHR